jgi:hypothetical protein
MAMPKALLPTEDAELPAGAGENIILCRKFPRCEIGRRTPVAIAACIAPLYGSTVDFAPRRGRAGP